MADPLRTLLLTDCWGCEKPDDDNELVEMVKRQGAHGQLRQLGH